MAQKSRFTVGLNDDLHTWLFDQIGEGKRWWNPSHAITEAVRELKERETAGHVRPKSKSSSQHREVAR